MISDEIGNVVEVEGLGDGVVVVAVGEFFPEFCAGAGEVVEGFHVRGSI